jgi:cell division protein FtsB
VTRSRVAALAGCVICAWVVVFSGEYSTFDWLTLRHQLQEERRAVRDLHLALDSLDHLAHALETDPAAQERAAREQFGMIRNGELLYRLVPRPDTGVSLP